jgi:hypothetical protein
MGIYNRMKSVYNNPSPVVTTHNMKGIYNNTLTLGIFGTVVTTPNLKSIYNYFEKMYDMSIETFIDELRNTDLYIRHIYTEGGCYKFHILLSKLFRGSKPYISQRKNHIITKYRNNYYDIYGKIDNVDGYTKLKKEEKHMVEQWSFHKNNLLQLNECPHCEEPITYSEKKYN